MTRKWILMVGMMLACVGLAVGADTTTDNSAGGGSWWVTLLQGLESMLWIAVLSLIAWAAKLGIAKTQNDAQLAKIYDALTQAVDEVYESTVRDIKFKAADGKLTNEERRAVMTQAYKLALSKVDEPTRQVLLGWSSSKIVSAIKAIIEKKKAAAGKTVVVEVNNGNTGANSPAAAAAAGADLSAQPVPVSGQ
jgi:hypothetical protein